jgi:hypothetical protein
LIASYYWHFHYNSRDFSLTASGILDAFGGRPASSALQPAKPLFKASSVLNIKQRSSDSELPSYNESRWFEDVGKGSGITPPLGGTRDRKHGIDQTITPSERPSRLARLVQFLSRLSIAPFRVGELTAGQKAVCCFFAAMLLLMWAVTRLEVVAGPKIGIVSPRAQGGDEPHYMLVLLTLMYFHKLELGNAYVRNPAGLRLFDHHTIFVNRRTGHHAGAFDHDPVFKKPSAEVYEVSAHPMRRRTFSRPALAI